MKNCQVGIWPISEETIWDTCTPHGIPWSLPLVPFLDTCFLLMHTPGGSQGCLKYSGLCHLWGILGMSFRLLEQPDSIPAVAGILGESNQQVGELVLSLWPFK